MTDTLLPVAALVAAFVAADPLIAVWPRLRPRGSSPFVVGAIVVVIAFVMLGMPAAWPAAILAGIIAAAALAVEDRARRASTWLWIRLGALLSLAAVGGWIVPSLHGAVAAGRVGLHTALLWPPGWYVFLLIVSGGYITVEWGCTWVERAIQPFTSHVSFGAAEEGLPNGGRMIGRLERLLIYLFVLIGAPTAIGFLVTAKSILRFGEIKDRESRRLAEYIIIGTLMSFGFATLAAYLVRIALGGEEVGG